MLAAKNDPKLSRFSGSTEQIISWLGRWFLVKTFDELKESDIEEIRRLLDESDEDEDEKINS